MTPAERIAAARLQLSPGHPVGVTEEMIESVVHGFYARIRQDALLGPIFTRVIPAEAWPAHLGKMCDFWSSVMLMSGRFHGAPMPAHMRIGGLDKTHFEHWLALFAETVADLCPPDAAEVFLAKARMIAQSLQLGIAASRGEIAPISEVALSR